jgi:antitoxin MazE
MVKRLVRHGNSLALIIDRPVLDLLKITEDTPLEIETQDGKTLQITPVPDSANSKDVQASMSRVNKKFNKTLKNLAK